MSPARKSKKTAPAQSGNCCDYKSFRRGGIEALPVEDEPVDVVISNCVINLSADKEAVFREIRRVLKPGGRAAISDIVLLKELPEPVRKSIAAYTGRFGGAVKAAEYRRMMEAAWSWVKTQSCLSISPAPGYRPANRTA